MFDFHLHLARFASPQSVKRELLSEGLCVNTIACEPWEWDAVLNSMSQEKNIHYAFGIHPMIANRIANIDIEHLEDILQSNQDFHVGECGLDRRFDGYDAGETQEQIFARQVKFAARWNRPLQIHCVGDYSRILRIIQNVEAGAPAITGSIPQVILHRFGGDVSVVKSALKLLGNRAIFSLHADSFRKKATIAAIREIPSSQVRFETDADDESWTTPKIIAKLQEVQQLYGEIACKP